jgi:hypothetical protein
MMYGIGLPILFPVAAVSLFTLYMVEKLMIYYSYRQPPMYDAGLNESVLKIMSFAPLLFLSFGYWMLSNIQLFSNTVFDIAYGRDNRLYGHKWTSAFSADSFSVSNPATPLIVMFWVFLVLIILNVFFYKIITGLCPKFKVGDLQVNEELENYFETLDTNDRNFSIKEEENSREVMGL